MVLFIGMAFLSLIIELWKDITTLEVDSRRAWFMQGAGIALALSVGSALNYILAAIIIVIINGWIVKKELKYKKIIFADGDKEILRWLVPGTFALYPIYAVSFLICLIPCLAATTLLSRYTKSECSPGLISIFAAYVMTGTLLLKGLLIL